MSTDPEAGTPHGDGHESTDPPGAAKSPRDELAGALDFVLEQARSAKARFDDEALRNDVTSQVSGLAAQAAAAASSAFSSLAAAAQTASAALDGWAASQRTEDPVDTVVAPGTDVSPHGADAIDERPADRRPPTGEDAAWD